MRKAHWLKANKGVEIPVHCIFYDTETKSYDHEENTEEAKLWFGWACYTRRYRNQTWGQPTWCRFTSTSQLARWMAQYCKPKRKLYIFAHNQGFDFTVVKGFKWLRKLGWTPRGRIIDGPPTIIRYRKDGCSLCFLDTLNYFRLSLKQIGEFVGRPKLEMPEEADPSDMWDTYCREDVLIMVAAMQKFWKMVDEWQLGNFAYTLAGQAFAAFRHRFMNIPIFIDDNEEAAKLSRKGYVGARTECFQIGKIEETVHCLDINSQYPFIMATTPVPIRLVTTLTRSNCEELKQLLQDYCIVADVDLTTTNARYPKKIPGWTIFPIGEFRTVLNTPELKIALDTNAVREIYRVVVYEKAVIFRKYVDFFYEERLKAKAESNETLSWMLKLMLNSLYGKTGQTGRKYEKVYETTDQSTAAWAEWDRDTKTYHRYRRFAGVVEEISRESESRESFPAIAGHITSAARVLLLDYINQAGKENALYCDTDSLFVTDRGYDNLRGRISENQLGWLKHEWTSDEVQIYGCKDYTIGKRLKRKGIRRNATEIDRDTFIQDQFRGFKGMIQDGDLDHMLIRQVTKHLSRVYSKGEVDLQGKVHPLVFPHPDYPDQ